MKGPDIYLGSDIRKYYVNDSDEPDRPCWAISSETYVKRAIREVEIRLSEVGQMLSTRTSMPAPLLSSGYKPEADRMPELGGEQQTCYQGLVGTLCWI